MLVPNFNTETPESADYLTQFNFFDTTGIYNGTTNKGGYGSPNPTVGSIIAAAIYVTPYLQTTVYTIPVFSASIPFPNTAGNPFVVLNTDLGLTGTAPIISGIYNINYQLSDVSNTYQVTKYVYLDAQHWCCFDKILSKATAPGCADRLQMQTLAVNLWGMINSVHAMLAPNCDEIDSANDIVKQINAICVQNGCGCGQPTP